MTPSVTDFWEKKVLTPGRGEGAGGRDLFCQKSVTEGVMSWIFLKVVSVIYPWYFIIGYFISFWNFIEKKFRRRKRRKKLRRRSSSSRSTTRISALIIKLDFLVRWNLISKFSISSMFVSPRGVSWQSPDVLGRPDSDSVQLNRQYCNIPIFQYSIYLFTHGIEGFAWDIIKILYPGGT